MPHLPFETCCIHNVRLEAHYFPRLNFIKYSCIILTLQSSFCRSWPGHTIFPSQAFPCLIEPNIQGARSSKACHAGKWCTFQQWCMDRSSDLMLCPLSPVVTHLHMLKSINRFFIIFCTWLTSNRSDCLSNTKYTHEVCLADCVKLSDKPTAAGTEPP